MGTNPIARLRSLEEEASFTYLACVQRLLVVTVLETVTKWLGVI